MKSLSPVSLGLLLLLPACGTSFEWKEFRSGPTTQAEVYDAIQELAIAEGLGPSGECDRGLAVWVSRWRLGQIGLNRPGRIRLHAEILLDESNPAEGFTVRYWFERQKVEDLRHSQNPREEDWSDDGQDSEREYLFGQKLQRRLPKARVEPEVR